MKKYVWLNYLLICVFIGLFTACSDEDDENASDNSKVSDQEICITMVIDGNEIKLGLDGDWMKESSGLDEAYASQFLKDYKTTLFPEDLTINWGDGTETSSTTHKYAISGTYQVTLKCKNLRSLYVYAGLKEINLSQATDLEYLCFEHHTNSSLKVLDISHNRNLKVLISDNFGRLPYFDFSNNTNLMYLDCYLHIGENGELDFSKNTELRYLNLNSNYTNKVTSLNIKGCNELIYLDYAGLSDEAANQVYRDLPQGKTWTHRDEEYSSYIDLGGRSVSGEFHPIGDFSIAVQKGWKSWFLREFRMNE